MYPCVDPCVAFICFLFKRSISMIERDPTTILSRHLFLVLMCRIELNYSKQVFHLMWIASENSLVWIIVWALLQHWNRVSKWASFACGLLIKKYSEPAHDYCEVVGLKFVWLIKRYCLTSMRIAINKNETVEKPSYLYNGNSLFIKTSIYWLGPQNGVRKRWWSSWFLFHMSVMASQIPGNFIIGSTGYSN